MKEPYDCGLIIKQLREKANMTQRELGRRISRDKGIISRYENNYQPVPFETMRTFAAIFNVSMDYLAGMEKLYGIPTTGLTEDQIDIMRSLSKTFCDLNNARRQITEEQYNIIGKIVTELFKPDHKQTSLLQGRRAAIQMSRQYPLNDSFGKCDHMVGLQLLAGANACADRDDTSDDRKCGENDCRRQGDADYCVRVA